MTDTTMPAGRIRASVIIPCLNEAGHLGPVLDAVLRQDGGSRFEVIVVDGGSSDASAWIAQRQGARVICSRPGVSAQRNRGVRASRGDILVFLDADCVVGPGWLQTGLAAIDAGADLVGGPVLASEQGGWVGRAWDAHLAARRSRLQSNPKATFRLLTTQNLFVRRHLFERGGGFDESLVSGEDYFFCWQVDRLGGRVRFDDALRVTHLGQPATARSFFRQQVWHCNSEVWRRLGAGGRSVGQAAYRYGLLTAVLTLGAVSGATLSCVVASWWPGLTGLALFAAPAAALSARTCAGARSVREFVPLVMVYLLYGLARATYIAGLSRRIYGRSEPATVLAPTQEAAAGLYETFRPAWPALPNGRGTEERTDGTQMGPRVAA